MFQRIGELLPSDTRAGYSVYTTCKHVLAHAKPPNHCSCRRAPNPLRRAWQRRHGNQRHGTEGNQGAADVPNPARRVWTDAWRAGWAGVDTISTVYASTAVAMLLRRQVYCAWFGVRGTTTAMHNRRLTYLRVHTRAYLGFVPYLGTSGSAAH